MMSYSLNDAHVQHVNDLSCIYIYNYFGPYQTDLGPVSDRIGNGKKKKTATDSRAATSMATRRVRAYRTWVRWPKRHTCAS